MAPRKSRKSTILPGASQDAQASSTSSSSTAPPTPPAALVGLTQPVLTAANITDEDKRIMKELYSSTYFTMSSSAFNALPVTEQIRNQQEAYAPLVAYLQQAGNEHHALQPLKGPLTSLVHNQGEAKAVNPQQARRNWLMVVDYESESPMGEGQSVFPPRPRSSTGMSYDSMASQLESVSQKLDKFISESQRSNEPTSSPPSLTTSVQPLPPVPAHPEVVPEAVQQACLPSELNYYNRKFSDSGLPAGQWKTAEFIKDYPSEGRSQSVLSWIKDPTFQLPTTPVVHSPTFESVRHPWLGKYAEVPKEDAHKWTLSTLFPQIKNEQAIKWCKGITPFNPLSSVQAMRDFCAWYDAN